MNLDAIIVLTGGTNKIVDSLGNINYASTTYEDGDAFGVLGGYARVKAAFYLSKQNPLASIITTSKRLVPGEPTHAEIMKRELLRLGISEDRIILSPNSVTTLTAIIDTLKMVAEKNWEKVAILTSDYHVPRVKAFYEHLEEFIPKGDRGAFLSIQSVKKRGVSVNFLSAEKIIVEYEPDFVKEFGIIREKDSYKKRLMFEVQGVLEIENGVYGRKSGSIEEKIERKVN